MLMDQAMNVMEKFILELKEAEPEKREHLIKSAVTILEISTETLKLSPEFRKAFAEVHAEFLKYPECQQTLFEGIKAYEKYTH